MLTSVSTLFVVVRFDTGESQMGEIVEAPQPIVLSFCGKDTELSDEKGFVGGWLRPVVLSVFVYMANPLAYINCLVGVMVKMKK